MKRILNVLFLAGFLMLLPAPGPRASQSNAQDAANPQSKTMSQESPHGRHHRRHASTNSTRRRRHHKSSAKH